MELALKLDIDLYLVLGNRTMRSCIACSSILDMCTPRYDHTGNPYTTIFLGALWVRQPPLAHHPFRPRLRFPPSKGIAAEIIPCSSLCLPQKWT